MLRNKYDLMLSKKNKDIKDSKAVKHKTAFLAGIRHKKLLTEPKDKAPCDIASEFENQFYYL
ncbi:MAG TPA: hypothetical protein PK195_07730, partial [Ignavibacteriaceae bacterium]|nr:hypothetical protein [Ignavibacteriaceae bacterium]